MKTLIGVDAEGHYRSALDLTLALDFPEPSIVLAHIVRPLLHVVPVVMPMEMVGADSERALCQEGDELVSRAAASVPPQVACKAVVSVGTPVQRLLSIAAEENADLLALGAGRKYRASYYFGSVSRALAVSAPQSMMVAKGAIPAGRKLRAVFATDHSGYASRCLDKLCSWRPAGIGEIHLLTALDFGEGIARIQGEIHAPIDLEAMITERLQVLSHKSAERLREVGYEVSSELVRGYANEVIPLVMEKFRADLLILGARGHGFVDQLLIGSVSLHQISRESYPVLVIRV